MYDRKYITEAENLGVLTLVNPRHRIPKDWCVDLVYLSDGKAIDRRVYQDLQEMLNDCYADGAEAVICSSYRSHERQIELFKNKVNGYMKKGFTPEEAQRKAEVWVAIPGTSEHELGLSLDIVDDSYQELDEAQEDTKTQRWLMNNCWKYGFILRYPKDKCNVTGISYEPWHYRYVGKEAAKCIYEQGICLEEYLEKYFSEGEKDDI